MEFKLIDLAVSVTKLASYLSIHQTYYISYIFILYISIYMDHIFILYLTYIYMEPRTVLHVWCSFAPSTENTSRGAFPVLPSLSGCSPGIRSLGASS